MGTRLRTFLLMLLAGAVAPALLLALLSFRSHGSGADLLEPGVPRDLELDPLYEAPLFRVRVPRRATSLRLWTSDASADVELYVRQGRAPDPWSGDYDVAGEGVWIDEEVLVDVTDTIPLAPGDWFVQVIAIDRPASCRLHAELVVPEPRPLEVGAVVDAVLERSRGLRLVWEVELAAEAEERGDLIFELVSPLADVNALVGPTLASRTLAHPWAEATSNLHYERLAIDGAAVGRRFALHVWAYPEYESLERIPVRLSLSPAEAPAGLCPPPGLPVPVAEGSLGRAMAATVAVFGPLGIGSGVVVSEEGHVLTNAHVVVGARQIDGEALVPGLAAGFHRDPRALVLPEVGLELVDYREDLDLALLRITSNLDLSPLPEDARFPFVERAPDGAVAPGDALIGLGYPSTGGAGSMLTITLTRGVHSGFAPEPEGTLIKTDMPTHAGLSGGACVTEDGGLVGLPSSSISDSNLAGGLGFVLPLELVPEGWREAIGWP